MFGNFECTGCADEKKRQVSGEKERVKDGRKRKKESL